MGDRAIFCRPLRGLDICLCFCTWGLRPRLYASACFAGYIARFEIIMVHWRPSAGTHLTHSTYSLVHNDLAETLRKTTGPYMSHIHQRLAIVVSKTRTKRCVPTSGIVRALVRLTFQTLGRVERLMREGTTTKGNRDG
jgi:hypothetical protein